MIWIFNEYLENIKSYQFLSFPLITTKPQNNKKNKHQKNPTTNQKNPKTKQTTETMNKWNHLPN